MSTHIYRDRMTALAVERMVAELATASPRGRILAAARMTQLAFAQAMGTTNPRLHRIFDSAEQRQYLSPRNAHAMARLIGVTPSEVYAVFGITRTAAEIRREALELRAELAGVRRRVARRTGGAAGARRPGDADRREPSPDRQRFA